MFDTSNAPKRIAAYLRVSTDEQFQSGTLENQRLEIARFSEFKRFDVLDYYEDGAVSGTKPFFERDSGRQLWDAIERGEFDAVVVYRIDRIARKIKHVLDFVEHAESNGCRIVTVNENIDFSSQWGKLILSILAAFAEAEHDAIRERAIAGKRRKLTHGKVLGRPPYGYQNIDGNLVIDEARAPYIREIFDKYLEGQSYRKIQAYLNAGTAPLPPDRYGKEVSWKHHHIAYILRSSTYCGEYRGFSSLPMKNYKYIPGGRNEADIIPVSVPAIVSKDIFFRTQKKIEENNFLGPQSKTRFYLLRGKIKCGVCGKLYSGLGHPGGTYTRTTGKKAGKTETYPRRYYYECSSKYKTYQNPEIRYCGNANLRVDEIEQMIWEQIETILRRPSTYTDKIVEMQRSSAKSINSLYSQLAKIESQEQKSEARRKRVVRAIADGTLMRDEAASTLDEIRREIESLNEQKVKIQFKISETDATKEERLVTVKTVLDSFAAKLSLGLTDIEKRQLVELLCDKIVVFPEIDPATNKKNARVEVDIFFDESNFYTALSGQSRLTKFR